MGWYAEHWSALKDSEAKALLKGSRHGLEREGLRVDSHGALAQTPHPHLFGSKLTHPWITTDFAEAQLELVTPALSTERSALQWLKRLHAYVSRGVGDEELWPLSTPCGLPDERAIALADYGCSDAGRLKTLYREGLAHRYGKRMQMLSGVHYNFSFSHGLWRLLHERSTSRDNWQDFRSNGYLHLMRNFLRWGWLNTYLFGATPAVHRSYIDETVEGLEPLGDDAYYNPYACSLRMSTVGYYSKVQTQDLVSTANIQEYVRDLEAAISTPFERWQHIPEDKQINTNLLQIEAEYYARMRPKSAAGLDGRVVDQLRRHGVSYVEARAVDLQPYEPDGITVEQLTFLHTFLVFCFAQESPLLDKALAEKVTRNQNVVAMEGRRPGLQIELATGARDLRELAAELLVDMQPVAELLDEVYGNGRYVAGLRRQQEKLAGTRALPSEDVLKGIEGAGSYAEFGRRLAIEHTAILRGRDLSDAAQQRFAVQERLSVQRQEEMERRDDFVLRGYEHLELSTQMVIREARARGVQVEVLDADENLIRLTRGEQQEYVKQASMTRRDNLISYYLMENKAVSKQILEEAGIRVPRGQRCESRAEALQLYNAWDGAKVVIKPNATNYGVGVSVIDAGDVSSFEHAIGEALRYGPRPLIEEYIPGEEYRFLVIDGNCVAVCQRVPAHVVGDGTHSVAQLIKMKNSDSRNYKLHKYRIRTGKLEQAVLAEQGYLLGSVPPRGTTVYLRRVSNVSTGGDPIDFTDAVHPGWAEIVVRAAKAVDAVFCGLDVLTPDVTRAPDPEHYGIIEVNFNPALFLHRYPVQGAKRYVERDVLDALGFTDPLTLSMASGSL